MGNGEAPYTTLGIPFKAEKLVPFYAEGIEWTGQIGRKGEHPRSRPCRVVGYAGSVPGVAYRCYDEATGRLFVTGDVTLKKRQGIPASTTDTRSEDRVCSEKSETKQRKPSDKKLAPV